MNMEKAKVLVKMKGERASVDVEGTVLSISACFGALAKSDETLAAMLAGLCAVIDDDLKGENVKRGEAFLKALKASVKSLEDSMEDHKAKKATGLA